jgi:GMP synthase-like glutamine amidotransferase
MGRILVLQHVWECPTGYVGELLQEHKIEHDIVNVETDTLPEATMYDAVIAFGGSQHIYAVDDYPYFLQERALIQTIIEHEIPFLGICLGGQLLSDVLGGKVRKHTMTEIGFFDVELTEEGKKDPLFVGLPGYQKVYHWHEDTFALPEGALLLARSDNTENQAFRYGSKAYGLQYHIELDEELLHLWLEYPEFKQSVIDTIGDKAYEKIVGEKPLHHPTYLSHTRIMIENFLRISALI